MDELVLTRFNNSTWNENVRWREENNYNGCIYNSPVRISPNIPLQKTLYVIEMNNDTNEILGFGKISNHIYRDKQYRVYTDNNYNRYTYRGKKRIDPKDNNHYTYKGCRRIDINNIQSFDQKENLQDRLFKNKTHLKRGQGLTRVPQDVTNKYYLLIKSLFD